METMETDEKHKTEITPQRIDEFIDYLSEKNRGPETLKKYRADLFSLYNSLPDGAKFIYSDSIYNWQQLLIKTGFAYRTVNARVSAANSFLSYLGYGEWKVPPIPVSARSFEEELSREEYLKLLEAAKKNNMEQLFFLLKLLCCVDIIVSDIPHITVNAVQKGQISSLHKHKPRHVAIPLNLQAELLHYIDSVGIKSGRLFRNPEGNEINKAYINNNLRSLCSIACIPTEKGSVSCLKRLRQKTYSDIRNNSSALIEQEYNRLLGEERNTINWHNSTSSSEVVKGA